MAAAHKWAFKTKFRSRAFGWRGSRSAITRLKEAVAEIKVVAKSDAATAGEGAVALMERLYPALEVVDTSSGALGNAVNHALDELIPILVAAPVPPGVRSNWLERLYQAVLDDGIEYLTFLEDRWGEVAVYPELMNEYADRLRGLIRRVWTEERPGGYVKGTTICLSCLLETGRYEDLLDLLACALTKLWGWHWFGAEALARQALWDAAIAYADGCRDTSGRGYDDRRISAFCEDVLIRSGRADEAYRRYGLTTGTGPTYVAIYKAAVRRYPDKDRRQLLLDLIEARGQTGKWFAAAKDAGYLDIALQCAAAHDADPATLIRAARDFANRDARFSVQVALLALHGLLAGCGYEPDVSCIHAALHHLASGAARLGAQDWAAEQIRKLLDGPCAPGREHMRQALAVVARDLNTSRGPTYARQREHQNG